MKSLFILLPIFFKCTFIDSYEIPWNLEWTFYSEDERVLDANYYLFIPQEKYDNVEDIVLTGALNPDGILCESFWTGSERDESKHKNQYLKIILSSNIDTLLDSTLSWNALNFINQKTICEPDWEGDISHVSKLSITLK
jgi:hypothetical protein